MRLIDADKLMEQVKVIHRAVVTSKFNILYDTGFHSATSQIQGLIDTMPTAYDTDKVIEQLEELRDTATEAYGINGVSVVVAICNAIDIVKKGGV